jgi:hypothetical protein
MVSFHWAIQPTVRWLPPFPSTARSSEQHCEHGGRETECPQRDARIEVDVRVELLLDEILVVERDLLQLHGDIQKRVVLDAQFARTSWVVFCMILARGS